MLHFVLRACVADSDHMPNTSNAPYTSGPVSLAYERNSSGGILGHFFSQQLKQEAQSKKLQKQRGEEWVLKQQGS